MNRIRPLESRLRRLAESRKYQEDFNRLKERILSEGEQLNYRSARLTRIGFDEFKKMGSRNYHRKYPLRPSFAKIKEIISTGNINEQCIVIPEMYSDFKDRWDLESLFDPSKEYSDNVDPFRYRRPVTPCFMLSRIKNPSQNLIPKIFDPPILIYRCRPNDHLDLRNDHNRMYLEIDRGFKIGPQLREIARHIRYYNRASGIKDQRRERYSDGSISQVRTLMNDGYNRSQIFRILHPKFKNFKYSEYIVKLHPNSRDREAVRLYKRICRLEKRIKEMES